jgi:hypothetical protein
MYGPILGRGNDREKLGGSPISEVRRTARAIQPTQRRLLEDPARAASPGGPGALLAGSAGAPVAELPGDHDRRRPRVDSELVRDVLLAALDGLERDHEFGSDLPREGAGGHQVEHLPFA